MIEYFELGPTPCDEDCAQVGSDNFHARAMSECQRYKALLEKQFPPIAGTRFAIKGFPHDFGTYYEVVIKFDPTQDSAVAFAHNVECNLPANWSD